MTERFLPTTGIKWPRSGTFKECSCERISGDERARIQATAEQLSRWMDSKFEVPLLGWRFVFDAIIGLILGLGDAATTIVSLYILTLASRSGVPKVTLARMGLNVAIDSVLGSLPLVGDAFDVWWKANQMNARLLRERLAEPNFVSRRGAIRDGLFVGAMLVILLALFAGMLALTALIAGALWNTASGLFYRLQ